MGEGHRRSVGWHGRRRRRTEMQNDDYLEMLRAEWNRILGGRDTTVTDAEQSELRRLLAEQDERRETQNNVS